MSPKVLILIGSDSDCHIVSPAVDILRDFNVEVTLETTSAHRTPRRTVNLVRRAEKEGVEVIIAAAGYAAHLAGAVAANTHLPVIGIPVDTSPLKGIDSLLSTVMMPAGIPVATVTVGKTGAVNAAYLALSILSIKYEGIKESLSSFRKKLGRRVSKPGNIMQEKNRT